MLRSTRNLFTRLSFFLLTFEVCKALSSDSKEERRQRYREMAENVEPFRANLTDCARQTKATLIDVENFLKRIPQDTPTGKCFVACILKRNSLITNNKVSVEHLLESNQLVYGDQNEVMIRLKEGVAECTMAVEAITDVCEYASVFNDCMHRSMENVVDQESMDEYIDTIGQMRKQDQFDEEEDEYLKLMKDEL